MNAQAIVERFLREPAAFPKLGQGHRLSFYDPPSSVVYQVPDQPLVLKTYGPHANKREPLERAQHEYEMLMRVIDLPGTPNMAELVTLDGAAYLIREAGDLPSEWSAAQILQVQETIETLLLDRNILLNDRAQVAVRTDGTAFIYDLESAEEYGPPHDRLAVRIRWEKASESFEQWLRAEGYPERPLRAWMRRSLEQLEALAATGFPQFDQTIYRYKALMEREDQLRASLERGECPPAGNLWSLSDWNLAITSLTRDLERVRYHKEQLAESASRGAVPSAILKESMHYWETREAALEAQLARAESWVALCMTTAEAR